jgi:hypothetical protein
MNAPIFTNIAVYKAIADEAYLEQKKLREAGRHPKPDGSPGFILAFDPN